MEKILDVVTKFIIKNMNTETSAKILMFMQGNLLSHESLLATGTILLTHSLHSPFSHITQFTGHSEKSQLMHHFKHYNVMDNL